MKILQVLYCMLNKNCILRLQDTSNIQIPFSFICLESSKMGPQKIVLGLLKRYFFHHCSECGTCSTQDTCCVSLCRRFNLTLSAKQCIDPCSVSQWTQWNSGSVFGISLQPDWQIYNGIFNRPVMAHTLILVHSGGPITRILTPAHRWTVAMTHVMIQFISLHKYHMVKLLYNYNIKRF